MVTDRTEEEQIEALKNWWNENGTSLLITIALALAGVFGYQAWQRNTVSQGEAASAIYQDMLEAAIDDPFGESTDKQIATARSLAQTLKTDFASSSYAKFAALHVAKLAVEEDDLDSAEIELRWVLDHDVETSLELITRLRLARVLWANGNPEAALASIENVEAAGYTSAYEETKGDLYLELDRPKDARSAYQKGLNHLFTEGSNQVLQMKLDDIPVPKAEEEAKTREANSSNEVSESVDAGDSEEQ